MEIIFHRYNQYMKINKVLKESYINLLALFLSYKIEKDIDP